MKRALGHNKLSYEKRGGHPDKIMKLWRVRLHAAGFESKDWDSSHSPDGGCFNNGSYYKDQFGNKAETYRHLGVTARENSYHVKITLNIPDTFENHTLKEIKYLENFKKRTKGLYWDANKQEEYDYLKHMLKVRIPLDKITEEEKIKFFKFYEEKMSVRGGSPMDLIQSRELDAQFEFKPYGELMYLYTQDKEAFSAMREQISLEV
jgi:hypothetical protein